MHEGRDLYPEMYRPDTGPRRSNLSLKVATALFVAGLLVIQYSLAMDNAQKDRQTREAISSLAQSLDELDQRFYEFKAKLEKSHRH